MNVISNEYKNFDIVDSDKIETIGVRQLTLSEREKLFSIFDENIKNRKRKEFIEISKLMEPKEKTKFLVECASSNKPSMEEIIEESQTVNGITEIFKLTVNKQLDWIKVLSDSDAILPILKAYYYSLGIEVPDEVSEDITQQVENASTKVPVQEQSDKDSTKKN